MIDPVDGKEKDIFVIYYEIINRATNNIKICQREQDILVLV